VAHQPDLERGLEAIHPAPESGLSPDEGRYQALVNHLHDIIFQMDATGAWRFLNPAWSAITGYSVQETVGQQVSVFLHPDDYERVAEALASAASARLELPDLRCFTKSGEMRYFHLRAQVAHAIDGTLRGITGTLIDMTDRKQNEARVAELAAKERSLTLMRTLVSNLSHDLRTPLSVMSMQLSLLRRKVDTQTDVEPHIASVERQIDRMVQIVNNISMLSRLEHDGDRFDLRIINLNQIVEEAHKSTAALAQRRQVEVMIQPAETDLWINGDAIWLVVLVKHLIVNAIQHSTEAGQVLLTTEQRGVQIGLAVTDNGCGIPPEHLPYIFDHFYRAQDHRPTQTGGAGLGLTIAKRIADGHQATINVQSAEGQGTTFTVLFPAAG
jgi:PAS domain S-box-containing protein